jgi:ABC-type branched-subunit amino acid transport system substrate-binding protein
MTFFRLRIFSIFFALPLFCATFAVAEERARVGLIGAFSGPAQVYGTVCKNGLEMARKDFKLDSFDLVYEDDEFSTAKTVAAFKKLVEVDKVKLVLSVGSGPSKAIAPLALRYKVPLIAWAWMVFL